MTWNCILFLCAALIIIVPAESIYNLTLLHTNDVHAHYVEFNEFGGRCPPDHAKEGKCFGGFARQVTKVKEIRDSHPNVLFLNGGDFFQGTVWYTLYKYKAVAEFVNMLTIDAMSLGNHEFDDGLKDLIPYLETVKPVVVVCNINATQEPDVQRLIKPSTIIEVGGEKIGVIGFLTPDTKFLSSVGKLEFIDEVECISHEAKRLTNEEGIKKIIAVGHSGYVVDEKIAREVPEIDIVVGGHTNTFLYSGKPPSVEEPQGLYPTLVERTDGSKALVVQDFAFGKYLGYLEVEFDEDGHILAWSGNPILLNSSVKQDPEVLELLQPYAEEVVKRGRQEVGRTNVLLRGDRLVCRMKECNLGNYLSDAALDFFISNPTEKGWTNVAVAVWNSGGIRGSIDERINNGSVILEDILTIAPFGNTMDIVGLKGKHLREVLEVSVHDYDVEAFDPPGSFLQVSGLRVTYNISHPPGSRVVDVQVRCADCRIPKFEPLNDERVYEVVMATYLTKGGDAFSIIPEYAVSNRNTDELDIDIITAYMKKCKPIIQGLEGRITVFPADNEVHSEDLPTATTEKHDDHHAEEATEHQEIHHEETTTHLEETTPHEITLHLDLPHITSTHHDLPHETSTHHETTMHHETTTPHDQITTHQQSQTEKAVTPRKSLFPGMTGVRDRMDKGMKELEQGGKKILDDITKGFPGIGRK